VLGGLWNYESTAGERGPVADGSRPGVVGARPLYRDLLTNCPGPARALKHLSVFLCKSVLYGIFCMGAQGA
jgi:hypothetical protein